MNGTETDVIVICAGLSGLAAATRLYRAGKRLCVIEARSRIGGRTLAGTIGAATVDLGGRITSYKGLIPRLPLPALIATAAALNKVNRLARRIRPSLGMPEDALRARDARSAEQGIRDLTANPIARELLRITNRAVICAEPEEISWFWFLAYVRAGRTIEALAGVKRAAQQDRIVGGAWPIADRLSRQLPPEAILRSSPVFAIARHDARLVAHYRNGIVSAPRIVVATAPSMMTDIDCDLPGFVRRHRLAQQMPMGRVVKSVLAYEGQFWRDAGFSGQAVSDRHGFGPVFDAWLPGQPYGLLVGFFEASAGGKPNSEDRRVAADAAIRRWFGADTPPLLDYAEHDWTSDPWPGGCYVGIHRPGALSADPAALREPCDGLHWAGTEPATEWIGYMDGAIEVLEVSP